MELPKFIVLEKSVGETPLSCAEEYRALHPELAGVSMAYAGRLDPMASGKLLVLLGEECKNQTSYHGLDKEYEFSVLFGVGSDSHDVLGRLSTESITQTTLPPNCALLAARPGLTQLDSTLSSPLGDEGGSELLFEGVNHGLAAPSAPEGSSLGPPSGNLLTKSALAESLVAIAESLTGNIELPYPHFSAKTVQGKPLHMWTLEGRLDEIEIPTKESTVYSLTLDSIETKSRVDVCDEARTKIDSIPEVTEERKALGNDFRRVDVRKDWENILNNDSLPDAYSIAHFSCLASSGTYMRTLAHLIGQRLSPSVPSLAWRIHRTKIGTYEPDTDTWKTRY
jgi:tRNA U55 pseudouridine synthase TruB